MNWSHNLISVLEEFKNRAAKLSVSMLSSRQKMKVHESNIEAYVTYSFPLGILTEADLAKLDGMNARLCKKINGPSNSAPTAMILEDRDRAGVGLTSLSVSYAQLIARNLVLALNDKGALGFITGSLIRLQDSILGSALEHTKKKLLIKGTTHYHLARQLAIIKQANIYLKAPAGEQSFQGNAMSDIIARLRYDPADLGLSCRIPLNVYQPLLELGLKDFNDLLIRHGKKPVFLSSDDLCLKYGKRAIRKRHKLALNRLTKIVNSTYWDAGAMRNWDHTSAMSQEDRVIHNPELFSELGRTATGTEGSGTLNGHECEALRLLEQWHLKRSHDRSSAHTGTTPDASMSHDSEETRQHNSIRDSAGTKPKKKRKSKAEPSWSLLTLDDVSWGPL